MKSCKLLLSAALVAVPAMAQRPSLPDAIAQFPKCAVSCLGVAMGKTQCSSTNETCMCTDQTLQDTMTTCVMGSCTVKETMFTKNLTATACNVPIRDKSGQYVAISNSFAIIAAVFVVQRFAYKYWAKLDYGPDDWFTLVTILSSIPLTIFNAYPMVQNGIGRDSWTLALDNVINFVKYFLILEVVYFADIALLKLALLFFYIRIFPGPGVRRLLWGTVILAVLFGITFVFLATFQCTPIDYYWWQWSGEPGHHGTCIDIMAVGWSNAAASIAIDGWMLAIPLWQLRSLKLDLRKKVGVAMMFCVGTFVTIVSMLRLRSLVQAGASTVNPTWDFFDVCIWSTVEVQVGIICVCMPSMRLLLVRLFPCLRGMSTRYYAKYASGVHPSTARMASRPLGTGTTSHVERSQHRPEVNENQITCQTTYTVEYGDKYNDEVQLVNMRELDRKSARSGSATSGIS